MGSNTVSTSEVEHLVIGDENIEIENHFVGVNYTEPLTTGQENLFVDLLRREIDATTEDHWRFLGIEGDHPELNPDFPYVVAIGPVSKERKMQNTKAIGRGEFLKVEYLKAFLNRTNLMGLASYVREIKKLEVRAYEFYNHSIDIESLLIYSLTGVPRFVFLEMLLLDSCFIIEVIWRFTHTHQTNQIDPLSMPSIILDARRDMILLDNQLPLFFLEALFNLAFNNLSIEIPNDRNFVKLCVTYLCDFMLIVDTSQAHENIRRQQQRQQQATEIKHFVDLLRICHAPSLLRKPPPDLFTLMEMPTTTQLDGAGMIIRPSSTTVRCLGSLLQIPKIKINDKSEFLLKNLIELELREYQYDSYIVDYLNFMGGLINSSKDVDILVESGVIENYLHNNPAVAKLFNGIATETTLYAKNYYYYGICENLNAYCKSRTNRMLCDYGGSQWMIASSIAAGIMLVIFLYQMINAMISDIPIHHT